MRASLRLAGLVACIITIGWFLHARLYNLSASAVSRLDLPECHNNELHEISEAITNATATWDETLEHRTTTLAQAAAEYRRRRGRHPPPGFDVWHERAARAGAVLVEDFFDQIYHDLELFWGIRASDMRASIAKWSPFFQIRNGKASEISGGRARSRSWAGLVASIARDLPDMDLALNGLDEPIVIASWKTVDNAMYHASIQAKRMEAIPLAEFSQTFAASRTNPQSVPGHKPKPRARWNSKRDKFHEAIRGACPPESTLRKNGTGLDHHSNMPIGLPGNITSQRDLCEQPELMTSHGYLLSPDSINFTTSPIPIFSTAKTRVNNDILLPDPAYYENKAHSGKDFWGDWSNSFAWQDKVHGLIWRGAGTGGANCINEYSKYHRHRFVARLNATSIDNHYDSDTTFTSWLPGHANASFTRLFCDKITSVAEHFSVAKSMKMSSQYKWKYLPDIDGNTLSGRFRAFMRSNSAVMKATIFTEWHDARLMPWKHYIPLEMSYGNIYEIMKYFLGYPGQCAHDREGERIAREGREWAEKVLRKEDMLIYVHRLLLEYARIVDDDRDRLGYVQDLLDERN
ncbi:Beta-1,2-xylosyltransferase 1 [Fulvia fulva]|uniref:Beta-1,2-xylosyltransferase 1 n=1 Tax=Passalora fulva TaxID=5499 RepID=A0A9Q8PA90_PASFU|nr:Beta-1,2-xylosyltransferase 1 [Fulvia fulva]KAK4622035.1 Beta-1,2-xylosyltransferase 1 [Fulvia fulva]KAK4622691.1 Beta-1,2-xylosyltransferase 1 [Fulvia fulva]UJO18768.1 Beta-1,2-xylosyltransferase 1 [Fulvia fulva]WPV16004.1 Beta-1,2-xylosyltransferase 1 [Fulvia fulva]WPV30698.1 Beta-1,2-xylosyltransferase 1 [Fulvia fulva]